MNYDMLIVGAEREGIECAISAAQAGRRVAVIRLPGAVPSLDQLRCAANSLVECGEFSHGKWRAEVRNLFHSQMITDEAEMEVLGIDLVSGPARFVSAHEIEVANGRETLVYHGQEIVIASGVTSWRPQAFYCDDRHVMTVESLLSLDALPQSAIIVGAGDRGQAAAMLLATLDVEVMVIDERDDLLGMDGILGATIAASQSFNIAFRLGHEVIGTELRSNRNAAVRLADGQTLSANAVVLSLGAAGKTQGLNLEITGVGLDERGRIWCDESGRTWAPHISVVGDLMSLPRRSQRAKVGPHWTPATERAATFHSLSDRR